MVWAIIILILAFIWLVYETDRLRIKLPDIKDELLVIDILTILVIPIAAVVPVDVLRIILGLPVALFFPGYTLLALLFPRKGDLDTLQRVALSFGLSLVVVALIGLILNYSPLGIRIYPVLVSNALFIIAMSVAASFRRRKMSSDERFSVSFSFRLTQRAGASRLDKVLSIGLIIAIVLALGTLGYAIASPDVGEKYTQFYVLSAEGKTEGYPKELVVRQEAWVRVGIVNHEHVDVSYRVEITVDGVINREVGPIVLAHQGKWEEKVSFVPTRAGENQKVEFLLYKDKEIEPSYTLYLWVDVKQ